MGELISSTVYITDCYGLPPISIKGLFTEEKHSYLNTAAADSRSYVIISLTL